MTGTSETLSPHEGVEQNSARARILDAAFAAFAERGYAQTTMLEIATRAKVSKRELYALVGNKHDMLATCIAERAGRMRMPADMPPPHDRDSLGAVLAAFGERLLREATDPPVLAVFRLAIAEAERAPEIAQTLDSVARAAARRELAGVIARARAAGLIEGDTVPLTARFLALLWGDLMVSLLLRLADPPTLEEAKRRARDAATAFLRLCPPADGTSA